MVKLDSGALSVGSADGADYCYPANADFDLTTRRASISGVVANDSGFQHLHLCYAPATYIYVRIHTYMRAVAHEDLPRAPVRGKRTQEVWNDDAKREPVMGFRDHVWSARWNTVDGKWRRRGAVQGPLAARNRSQASFSSARAPCRRRHTFPWPSSRSSTQPNDNFFERGGNFKLCNSSPFPSGSLTRPKEGFIYRPLSVSRTTSPSRF
jgi:hypothetical protein